MIVIAKSNLTSQFFVFLPLLICANLWIERDDKERLIIIEIIYLVCIWFDKCFFSFSRFFMIFSPWYNTTYWTSLVCNTHIPYQIAPFNVIRRYKNYFCKRLDLNGKTWGIGILSFYKWATTPLQKDFGCTGCWHNMNGVI